MYIHKYILTHIHTHILTTTMLTNVTYSKEYTIGFVAINTRVSLKSSHHKSGTQLIVKSRFHFLLLSFFTTLNVNRSTCFRSFYVSMYV